MSQELIPTAKPLRARILGIGGAGCNFADQAARSALAELPVSIIHTSARVLQQQSLPDKLLIGSNRTHGLGSGGDADLARVMAEEAITDVSRVVAETDLLFLFAGLGGGTGTGAAPVVARAAKQAGALVIAVVTLPFEFEGARIMRTALQGLQNLRAVADAVVCLPNQKALQLLNSNATILEAFARTNEIVLQGVRGLWQMLTRPGLISVDFAYLHSVLRGRHTESVLAASRASGEQRASMALNQLLANPLLDNGKVLNEADHVLLSIVGPRDLTIAEINSLSEQIRRQCETEDVVIGTALDDSLSGEIALTLIASKGGKASMGGLIDADVQAAPAASAELDTGFIDQARRPAPRFVAPPPETTPEKTRELLDKQPNGRILKTATKWKQELLALEIVSRGRFEKSEPTIHRGADLDVPTYVRRGMPLN